MTAVMEHRARNRKTVAIAISVLVFGSFAALGWVAANGRSTAHDLEVEVARAKGEDAQRGRDICMAINRKVLGPLGQAAVAQVPSSLATFASLIETAPNPEQKAAFEETRRQYLIGVQERSALYVPLDCSEPLGPQLPRESK